LDLGTPFRGPAALPDNRIVKGPAGPAVPDEGGLPLVGDPNGGDLTGGYPGLPQSPLSGFFLGSPDVQRVMLHPPRPGINLPELLGGKAYDLPPAVEDYGPRTRRPLIQSHDVLFGHPKPPLERVPGSKGLRK